LAVNHMHSWNPSYKIERVKSSINTTAINEMRSEEKMVSEVLTRLQTTQKYKSYFQPDAQTLQIFLEGNTVTVNLRSGAVVQEVVKKRDLLFEANFLHLNHPKKLWTYAADVYAIALTLLAITGLFVLKGKKGLTGRGAWLTLIGIALPIVFLVVYN